MRLTGDDDVGLHVAEWLAPRTDEIFDVLAFALRSCATLGEHYRRAGRYLRLVHDGIYLRLEEDTDIVRVVHGHYREPRAPPRHPVEALLTLAVLNGRRAIGEEFAPREVRVTHPRPARVSEHERIFRAPVHFGCPRNELVLDRALLERPQRHAEPRLLTMLDRQLGGLLERRPEPHGFIDDVMRCMLDQLPDQEPTNALVAARLHMSPRTLQRRLLGEGTNFAAVLSELRREHALRYLQNPEVATGEVGFLLGFKDVTAFHRAFKRWTGTTPAMFRREARSSGEVVRLMFPPG